MAGSFEALEDTRTISCLPDDAFLVLASFLEASDWISLGCVNSACRKICEHVLLRIQKFGYLCAKEIATAWYVGERHDAEELASYYFLRRGVPIYPPCCGYTLCTLFWRMRMEERAQTTDPSSCYLPIDEIASNDILRSREYRFLKLHHQQHKHESYNCASSRVCMDILLTRQKQGDTFEEVRSMANRLDPEMLQNRAVSYLKHKICFWRGMLSLFVDDNIAEERKGQPFVVPCHSLLTHQHKQREKPILDSGYLHALRSSPKFYNTNHPSNSPEALTRCRLRANGLLCQRKRAISLNTDLSYKSHGPKEIVSSSSRKNGSEIDTDVFPNKVKVDLEKTQLRALERSVSLLRARSTQASAIDVLHSKTTSDCDVLDDLSEENGSIISYDFASVQFPREMEEKLIAIEKNIKNCTTHAAFNNYLHELWDCFFSSTGSVSFFDGRTQKR